MAFAIAVVLSVVPSGLAPNFMMSNTCFGKTGAFTFFTMSAARAQASSEGIPARALRVAASDSARPAPATNWRRSNRDIFPPKE
jgi:hypothetical protein